MTRAHSDERDLRRAALAARAALQRMQIAIACEPLRTRAGAPRGIGAALRLVGAWAGARAGQTMPAANARPWLLSAGWLLLRALRVSPTVRWVVGAGAAGAAIWWVVRVLRTPEAADDDSG